MVVGCSKRSAKENISTVTWNLQQLCNDELYNRNSSLSAVIAIQSRRVRANQIICIAEQLPLEEAISDMEVQKEG